VLEVSGVRSEAVGIFLFGSALTAASPRDVDLLYVYRPGAGTARRAIELRRAMCGPVGAALGLEPHIILLNEREAAQTNFVQEEQCAVVWRKEPLSTAGYER